MRWRPGRAETTSPNRTPARRDLLGYRSTYPSVVGSRSVPGESTAEFAQALRDLRNVRLRSEVSITEVPAPSRIAPHAVALSAEVVTTGVRPEGDELASGRFVLLYDPSAPEPWDGVWRVVTFARAELEPELDNDPLLGAVGSSRLTDA